MSAKRMTVFNSLRVLPFAVTLALFSYAVTMTGCQPNEVTPTPSSDHDEHDHDGHDHDDHDGHDHDDHDTNDLDVGELMPIDAPVMPETLAEGVKQLQDLRDTVAKGFADKDPESVHDQLHSVGNLLECIEGLVDSGEMSEEAQAKGKAAVEVLFDAFGEVDAKLHGTEGEEYSDVSDQIDSAIKTLSELTAKEPVVKGDLQ